MEISVRVDDGRVAEAAFRTTGCATSIASGSMAVELSTGRTLADARCITQEAILEALGGLPEESEHCALLASNTLMAALNDEAATRSAPWKRLFRKWA